MFAFLYLIIPICLFFCTLKVTIIIPLMCLLVFVIFKLYKNIDVKQTNIGIKSAALILLFLLISGHGGFIAAAGYDIPWRNAMYYDLIRYPWPVVYDYSDSALVYYITYWLVPAGISKILGLKEFGSNAVLFVWTYIGLLILFDLLCDVLKAKHNQFTLVCLIFLGWSGINVIGMLFKSVFAKTAFQIDAYNWFNTWVFAGGELNGYALNYFLRTTFDSVANVYNQYIHLGICTLLFLKYRDKLEWYALIGLLALPYSPLGFIGLFLLMVLTFASELLTKKDELKSVIPKVFSGVNVAASISILPIFYFYYTANTMADVANNSILYLPFSKYTGLRIALLILYYLLYFGIYAMLIYKSNKNNSLFYISFALLLLLPLFRVGKSADLNFNASMAPYMIIMVLVIKELLTAVDKKRFYGSNLLLVIVLSVAMLTPMMQITNSLRRCFIERKIFVLDDTPGIGGTFADKDPKEFANFLSSNYKESVFFKYLVK